VSLNFFTLLQLPEAFVIDLEKLDQNYQSIQKEIHPDRFASFDDEAKLSKKPRKSMTLIKP
jgi:molecular chaperone HscB